MPPTDSFPWHCDNCGRVNDGGQLTCTLCGGLYKSDDPPGPPPALAHRPGIGRISRRFFLICLTVSLVGGLVFAYLSYTPFRILHAFQMSNGVSSIAWSPDSRVFAAVTFGGHIGSSIAMVSVWRASDGRQLYTYSYPLAPLFGSRLAWAPEGRTFAIAWDDGNVQIWGAANDYSSWQEQSSFHINVHASLNLYLTGIAWSADGKHLVMSYSDGELHVWDMIGGHPLLPVQAPRVAPQMSSILALSPDGTQAIVLEQQTGLPDATYAIWDVSTGKVIPLPSQSLNQAHEVTYGAWSADGNALAVSVGGKVMSWQWNKQRNSWTFVRSIAVATHYRVIKALAWSPDGKLLATADSANVIRMWSASTGDLLGPFRLPLFDHPNSKIEEYTDTDNAITGLAWSPNGTYLLSGNSPGQVILRLVLWRWGLA
jgi:WD40 repeat protein